MQFTQQIEKMPKRVRFETDKRKDSKRDKHASRMRHQHARRVAARGEGVAPADRWH